MTSPYLSYGHGIWLPSHRLTWVMTMVYGCRHIAPRPMNARLTVGDRVPIGRCPHAHRPLSVTMGQPQPSSETWRQWRYLCTPSLGVARICCGPPRVESSGHHRRTLLKTYVFYTHFVHSHYMNRKNPISCLFPFYSIYLWSKPITAIHLFNHR